MRRRDELIRWGVVVAVAAVALQTIVHLVVGLGLDNRYEQLDAGEEHNVWAWSSAVATFAVAIFALLRGLLFEERRGRWLAVALILAYFSLDDMILVHETLGGYFGQDVLGFSEDAGGRAFVVLYLPLLAFVFLTLWREVPERVVRVGLLLLVAAIVVEPLWGIFTTSGGELNSWPDDLEVAFEEGLELGGWILIAAGVAAALVRALEAPDQPAVGGEVTARRDRELA